MRPRRVQQKQQIVWASQLAEMTFCERRLLWKSKLGQQLTPCQFAHIAAGTALHARLHRQSLRVNPSIRTTKRIAVRRSARQSQAALCRLLQTLLGSLQRWLKALVPTRRQ